MARKLVAKDQLVKLIVGAGQASPSPPVGPALGSKGVKSMDFCKEFNALTAHITPGTPTPCVITIRPDRSFHFVLRTPPTSTLLLAAAGVEPSKNKKIRGANAPGRVAVGGSAGASSSSTAPAAAGAAAQGPGKTAAFSQGGGVGRGVTMQVRQAAGQQREVGKGGGSTQVGEVSLKHCYEIARIKQSEERLSGLSLEGLVKSVVAQARSCGVGVVP